MEDVTIQPTTGPHPVLSMSPGEATAIAKGDPDGWFIAGCAGRFIVGKLTTTGEQRIVMYRDQPLVFTAVALAASYLREMSVDWPFYVRSYVPLPQRETATAE